MLRINRQTDYAVRIILALATHPAGTRLASAAIQAEMQVPKSFMPRIVSHLANSGLIYTFTGRDGGLQLSRPPYEITLKDIVEAFEGPICLSECMQVLKESDCPLHGNCQVRSKWGRIQAVMLHEMDTINFASLADEVRANSQENVIPFSSP